jgi:hypothetical protein
MDFRGRRLVHCDCIGNLTKNVGSGDAGGRRDDSIGAEFPRICREHEWNAVGRHLPGQYRRHDNQTWVAEEAYLEQQRIYGEAYHDHVLKHYGGMSQK